MALNPGANQYTGPACSAKACFMMARNITTSVNKDMRAGPMSGLLIWMSMARPNQSQPKMFQHKFTFLDSTFFVTNVNLK